MTAGADNFAMRFEGLDGMWEVAYNHCLLYTFRAHETGRNLVCRLLLEKKKKKKKKKKKHIHKKKQNKHKLRNYKIPKQQHQHKDTYEQTKYQREITHK